MQLRLFNMKNIILLSLIALFPLTAISADKVIGKKKRAEADPSVILLTLQFKDDLVVEKITINRDKRCDLQLSESEREYQQRLLMGGVPSLKWFPVSYPLNIKFGNTLTAATPCNPIEVVVKTNKGTQTLEWND